MVAFWQRKEGGKLEQQFAQWLKKNPAPQAEPTPVPAAPSTPEREHHPKCGGEFCIADVDDNGCPCWCHKEEEEPLSSTFEPEPDDAVSSRFVIEDD